jgi:hypothetical protein
LVFVGVADDYGYAGESGDFFWGTLGVTARNYDLRFWILAADTADGGARVLVGACSDRAGVHYNY